MTCRPCFFSIPQATRCQVINNPSPLAVYNSAKVDPETEPFCIHNKPKMETKSIISSPASLSCSSLLSPVLCPQFPSKRELLLLSSTVTPRLGSVYVNRKSSNFWPKAVLRGNLEAIGVPTSVPVRVAHELLQAGHRYLDVRTPEEFSAGHAVGAINIPFMYKVGSGMTKNPKFLEQVSSHFRKHDEIIVGCQSGKRSLMAAAVLLSDGFTGITDIAGGYAAWTQNRLPTEH